MWDVAKRFFIYILKWLGLLGMLLLTAAMVFAFLTETSGMLQARETHEVEDKFTHKGLYFAQQYVVQLSNGDTHSVYKRDFDALEKGDAYHPFLNVLSLKDFLLICIISGAFMILWLSMAYFFAFLIFQETKLFQKLEAKRKKMLEWFVSIVAKDEKTEERWKKWSLLVLIVVLSIPYVLITKNIIIKTMPMGKESATGVIVDREIVKSTSIRRISNTYTLTYIFKDQDKQTYKTKKDVSHQTYRDYAYEPTIPIFYRRKFPYETFIDTKSVGEVISAIFRRSNVALVINAGLLVYLH